VHHRCMHLLHGIIARDSLHLTEDQGLCHPFAFSPNVSQPDSLSLLEPYLMSLSTSTRTVSGITVVDLDGRITLGEGTATLRDLIKDLVTKDQKNLVLNLGNVSYIDSAGLGELVGCRTTVTNAGGTLKLLNLQKKIQDLMQITKLYTLFEAFDDEKQAVQSFGSTSGAGA
jgi:anti-sigma B factor antagonist